MTALDDALAAGEVIWAKPALFADWDRDGQFGKIPKVLIAQDTFNRTLSNSMGSADTGQAYTLAFGGGSVNDFDVSPTNGAMLTMSTAGDADGRQAYFATPASTSDIEVLAQLQVAFHGNTDIMVSSVILRGIDASNCYTAELVLNDNNSIQLRIREQVAGVWSILALTNSFGIVHANANLYNLRAQCNNMGGANPTIRMKLWTSTSAEPDNWQLSITDTSFTNGSGKNVGIRSYMGPLWPLINPTVYYNDLQVWRIDPALIAGTIDDLGQQAGGSWSVSQTMDDGLPDTVTDTSSADASGTLSVPNAGPPDPLVAPGMTARKYFSPFNPDSPLHGYARDIAPMLLQQGVITQTGLSFTTIFTGQMASVEQNSGDTVSLDAASAARIAMMASVKLPMVNGAVAGLSSTWPVTHCAMCCGLNPSPPPGPFARWWSTFHGSMHPNMASPPFGAAAPDLQYKVYDDTGLVDTLDKPESTTGKETGASVPVGAPFVSAMWANQDPGNSHTLYSRFNPYQGWPQAYPDRSLSSTPSQGWSDLLSQANSTGRVSGWYHAQTYQALSVYGGVGKDTDALVFFQATAQHNGSGEVDGLIQAGLSATTGKAYVRLADKLGFSGIGGLGVDATLQHPTPFPTDDAWHFVEFGWNWKAGFVWITLDGSQVSTNLGACTASFLPTTEMVALQQGMDVGCFFIASLPVADWSLECDASFSNGFNNRKNIFLASGANAIIREVHPAYDLSALLEPTARDAWSIVSDISQGTLSAMRCDESDFFNFLPQSYFGETAQVVPSGTVTTDLNAGELAATVDPTKVRNSVTVQISDTRVDSAPSAVYTTTTSQSIPKGTSYTTYTLSGLQAGTLANPSGVVLTAADVAGGTNQSVSRHFATINTKSDGTGNYYRSSVVGFKVISVDSNSITVQWTNKASTPAYLANNGSSVPFLSLSGYAVTEADGFVTASDPDSIALRGERTLSAQLPYSQTRAAGGQAAAQLAGWLARPHGEVTVTVFGDPRRKPGQSVTLLDPSGTAIDGRWRIIGVVHTHNGGQYTQDLTLIELQPLGQWGTARWGDNDWNV